MFTVLHVYRRLQKAAGFSLLVIATVALGIGINIGFFSVTYGVLLQGLPVPNADRLILYSTRNRSAAANLSGPAYESLCKYGLQPNLLAWARAPLRIRSGDRVEAVSGALLSGNGFSLLQIKPVVGRFFDESDDLKDAKTAHPAVLSYGYWQTHYAGDPNVIGRSITVNGAAAYITGVLPQGFDGLTPPYSPSVILPLNFDSSIHGGDRWLAAPAYQWLTVLGRLPDGVRLDAVRANLRMIDHSVRTAADPKQEYLPAPEQGPALLVESGRLGKSQLESDYRRPLLALESLGIVLFAACFCNLVLLFVGRATTMTREIAIRAALGATRWRLLKWAAAEAAALAVCGAVLAVPVARGTAGLLGVWVMSPFQGASPQLPGSGLDSALNPALVLVALTLAVAACVAASLLGFLWTGARQPGAGLGTGRPTGKLRSNPWIISAEIAIAIVSITAATLGVIGFHKLATKPSGFSTNGTVIAEVDILDSLESSSEHASDEAAARIGRVIDAIRGAPGVTAVSPLSTPPLVGATASRRLTARLGGGGIHSESGVWPETVSAGYFAAMGTHIVRGRAFDDSDAGGDPVCVLGARTAAAFFGQEEPLGKFLFSSEAKALRRERGELACRVIGIAEDAHFKGMMEYPDKVVYQLGTRRVPSAVALAVHAERSELAAQAIAGAMKYAAPGSLPPSIRGIDELIANDIRRERTLMLLSCVSAAIIAVILGGGIFGTLTLAASRSRRDLAVRVALGATTVEVCQAMMREFLAPLSCGVLAGSLAILFAMRSLTKLYGTDPDMAIGAFAAATIFLLMIAIAAVSVPLRRAVSTPLIMSLLNE